VECKSENQTGYLPTLHLLVPYYGALYHSPCKQNVILTRWPVVIPLEVTKVARLMGQSMDDHYSVIERKTTEIGPERENPAVAAEDFCQDVRGWICNPEAMKGVEETSSGHRRKLAQPLDNNHLVIAQTDAPGEHIETIRDKGRVKTSKFGHCLKAFQGCQVNGFVKGCLERPRNASKV
jgi:hypothetical protein